VRDRTKFVDLSHNTIQKSSPRYNNNMTYLIIGIGNPDPQYSATRHNIGFSFLDWLAKQLKADDFAIDNKLQAAYSEGKLEKAKVILLKPQTYVNQSGLAAKKAKLKFKIPTSNIVIIHDDLDVPFGKTKLSPSSGAGGHKGVASIFAQLKTEKINRIKIGTANSKLKVARAERSNQKRIAMIGDFVLGKFTPNEQLKLKPIFKAILGKLTSVVR